jgi:hypothetical protein
VDIYKVGEVVKELHFVDDELSYLRDTASRIRVRLASRNLERSGVPTEEERMAGLRIIGNVGSIATNAIGRGKRQLTFVGTDVPAVHAMLENAAAYSDQAAGVPDLSVYRLTPREYEIHELTRSAALVAVLSNQDFTPPPSLR